MKHIMHLNDIGFTLEAEVHPNGFSVEFKAYEHPQPGDDAVVEVYMSGTVKFDGCSNWMFDECERCMLHACSRGELLVWGKLMLVCWDWASSLLGDKFEGSRT